MTLDEFVNDVMPRILSAWRSRCLCANSGFRKLLSFNFADYGTGPMALADSEIVSHQIIRENFARVGDVGRSQDGDVRQRYSCPQCNTMCEEEYAEYSISMDRSFFRFLDTPEMADYGLYLVGIRAFSCDDFLKVNDFREATSITEFLAFIGVAEQSGEREPPVARVLKS
ncbi:MAG: hypothetical protein U0795_11450 [Pirellulales bacterium]